MNKNIWLTIIAMLASAAVGYFANVYANRKNNELLIQLLKDQLLCIQNQQQQGRLSEAETIALNTRKIYLQTKLNSLT